jgi:RHS repeat-associated protein
MTYSYNGSTYFGTNTYTYTNDLVYTQTDPRGLTTTKSWDNLERLTSVAYPDSTQISYTYNKLDLVEIVDRLGKTTSFTYDSIRRKTSQTDANGHTTYYGYCDCGGLDYITNALGNVTQFVHDNQGNVTAMLYPDGYDVFNTFNSIQQLVVRKEGPVVSFTNYYDNQGLLTAVSNAAGNVLSRGYDINDRLTNAIDQNGVTTQMSYDELGRMLSRKYPDGGTEGFGYSPFGLMVYTNQLLTNITHYYFDAERRKIAETNALNFGTEYGYDAAGDLTNLTDQNGNKTDWGYDLYGRVTNKVDAANVSILQYGYDDDNRLTSRTSVQKGTTSYGYDNVGNLTSVTYSSNSALSFSYDSINEMLSMSDGIGTTTFTYTPSGQLASEAGPWASDTIAYSYTNRLRQSLNLQQPNASAWAQTYGYDDANRLHALTSPSGAFGYAYNSGLDSTTSSSSLVAEITLPNGGYISDSYDVNGRMTGTSLYSSGSSNLDSYAYTYNKANQRTQIVRNNENYVNYTYDRIGEVVSDLAYETNGTTRLNERLTYAFDPAGNLNYRTNNALIQNFDVNSLNELTANANSGTLTVVGTTTSQATNVTVNGTAASNYNDATFAATNMPLTTSYTAIAQDHLGRWATNTANVNLAASTTYQYDGNGNLTNDGLRNLAYDDENQLIQVSVPGQWLSQFQYDGKMRRRIRTEYSWQGNWVQTNKVYYVYDGNLVIQERDLNNLPTVTYTRGKDLSGSLEGAGGIGGLLARTSQAYADASMGGNSFYHADGNGNITTLINSSNAVVAKYLYDAFGNTLSKSGLLADANLYRFSSKEWHANSGLVCYLYRYYDANLQRWLTMDRLGESGFETCRIHKAPRLRNYGRDTVETVEGPNLYEFVKNNASHYYDSFGLGLGDPQPPNSNPACQAVQAAIEAAATTAIFDESFGNYEGWAQEMALASQLGALYEEMGCNDPPPPPDPPKPDPPCHRNTRTDPPLGPPDQNPITMPPFLWGPILEDCIEGICIILI